MDEGSAVLQLSLAAFRDSVVDRLAALSRLYFVRACLLRISVFHHRLRYQTYEPVWQGSWHYTARQFSASMTPLTHVIS
jgi:hypothetical protein